MSSSASSRPPAAARLGSRVLAVLALALAAVSGFEVVRVLVGKSFGLDEFTYAHAGWSIAQGLVPYRDFVFHHTPLLEQLAGLAFRILGDDPTAIATLRWIALPGLVLSVGSVAALAARYGALAAATAPMLLLSFFTFGTMGAEIRPEALATGLTLSAAFVLATRLPAPVRGLLAGAALGVAVWTSEKTLAFGGAFALAWLVDLAHNRRRQGPCLTGEPLAFLGGFLLALAPAAIWLVAADAGREFLFWCGQFPFLHERYYPGHPWWTYFAPAARDQAWLWPFAAVGLVVVARRVRASERSSSDPGLLLLGLFVTTFASFAVQSAAYPYSLIPWLAVVSVFAAVGFTALAERAAASRPISLRALGTLGLAVILLLGALASWQRLERRRAHDNGYQLEVLAAIDRLAAPTDPVYDNSGSYVARPHASPTYFTDRTLRRLTGPELASRQIAAIRKTGCTAFLRDYRTRELPEELQAFLFTHFQPWNGDLGLWGMPYERQTGAPAVEGTFLAVRAARYFVEPAAALERGRLAIGDREIREPIFELAQGEHAVRYEGDAPSFHLLWLPADGRRWTPSPGPARFSVVF